MQKIEFFINENFKNTASAQLWSLTHYGSVRAVP